MSTLLSATAHRQPESLMELNIRKAITSILNKHQWWVKWGDEEVRAKWLGEIRDGFLLETFKQTLVIWDEKEVKYNELQELLFKFEDASEEDLTRLSEMRKALDEWLSSSVTKFVLTQDEDESSSDDEDDEDEDGNRKKILLAPLELSPSQEEERMLMRKKELDEKLQLSESYASIKWAVSQLSVYEELKAIPLDDWEPDVVHAVVHTSSMIGGDTDVCVRAANMTKRLLRNGITLANLELALPVPEDPRVITEDKLEELVWHCERIESELKAVENYVVLWIGLQIKEHGLNYRSERDTSVIITPLCIPGTYVSDNALSEEIMLRFHEYVKKLENVPKDEKDWHPRSNNQVLDLVHPSLYCCVYSKTMRIADRTKSQFESALEQMEATIFAASTVAYQPRFSYPQSAFQWIPTEFRIDEGGSARALAYINNLHPRYHGHLYECIETIVGSFVPLFEKMVTAGQTESLLPRFTTSIDERDTSYLPLRPIVPSVPELHTRQQTVSLRSSTIKVIVKIAEIILTPENPRYAGGSWHVEGTGSEQIIGTGLYYFGCENITESRLAFRAEVTPPIHCSCDYAGVAAMFGIFNESPLIQNFGSAIAMNGRCVVFPNHLQHQVQPFELADKSKPGTRKILALFLVDPKAGNAVLSTSDIPAQQRSWQGSVVAPVLTKLSLDTPSKDAVLQLLARGMTQSEAEGHRLALMDERSARQQKDEQHYEQYYNLCEH